MAPIQPQAWEPPYAAGVALKSKKKKEEWSCPELGGCHHRVRGDFCWGESVFTHWPTSGDRAAGAAGYQPDFNQAPISDDSAPASLLAHMAQPGRELGSCAMLVSKPRRRGPRLALKSCVQAAASAEAFSQLGKESNRNSCRFNAAELFEAVAVYSVFSKIPFRGVPLVAEWVKNLTSVCEDMGLIPGLDQWLKDLALL